MADAVSVLFGLFPFGGDPRPREEGAKSCSICCLLSGGATSGVNSSKMVSPRAADGKGFQCNRLPKGGGAGAFVVDAANAEALAFGTRGLGGGGGGFPLALACGPALGEHVRGGGAGARMTHASWSTCVLAPDTVVLLAAVPALHPD